MGLLAIIYLIKRVAHLSRYADERDYPPPAVTRVLPLMRGSTDLEKRASDASDSSSKGLLPSSSFSGAGSRRSATVSSAGVTRGGSQAKALGQTPPPTAPPAAWATFSGPTDPRPVTLPPRTAPRLLSTVSEQDDAPLSDLFSELRYSHVAGPDGGRPWSAPPAPASNAARHKWSPPEGRGSALRWQVS